MSPLGDRTRGRQPAGRGWGPGAQPPKRIAERVLGLPRAT
jgi:hypothetical protein